MKLIRWFTATAEGSSASTNKAFLVVWVVGLLANAWVTDGSVFAGDRAGTAGGLLGGMGAVAFMVNESRALWLKRKARREAAG